MSLPLENSHISYTPWSVFQDGSYKAIITRSEESPSGTENGFAKGPELRRERDLPKAE